MTKTPQIKPDWNTGIYIGNGTIAVKPQSFRPMFRFGEFETQGNATRFATHEEALGAARDKFQIWTMTTDYFVEESADPANYTWNEKDGAKSIKQDA